MMGYFGPRCDLALSGHASISEPQANTAGPPCTVRLSSRHSQQVLTLRQTQSRAEIVTEAMPVRRAMKSHESSGCNRARAEWLRKATECSTRISGEPRRPDRLAVGAALRRHGCAQLAASYLLSIPV